MVVNFLARVASLELILRIFPFVNVFVNDVPFSGLLDSGCSKTVFSSKVASTVHARLEKCVTMMNGAVCDAKFSSVIALSFEGKTVEVDCLAADLFSGCDLLIGMDVVLCLGGVNIDSLG